MDSGRTFPRMVIRVADGALMAIAAIGLLAMMVHIALDVVASLLFNSPLVLTSTYVTQYYMIIVAFLPLVAAEYRGGHISVDLFVNYLSPAARRRMRLGVFAFCLLVYLMLAVQGWQQATAKLKTGAFVMEQTSQVVVWPSFFILPLAFGVAALLVATKLLVEAMRLPEISPEGGPDEMNPEARGTSV